MQVLFTTPPLHGHFHPMVPYARALRDAGHDVTFAGPGEHLGFQGLVAASGFDFISAGTYRDGNEIRVEVERENPRVSHGELLKLQFQRIFLEDSARTMADDLVRLFQQWQPDLVIRDKNAFGGWAAAERYGIPHATAGASLLWSPDNWQEIVDRPLQDLARHVGIDHPVAAPSLLRYLVLIAVPPALSNDSDRIAPTTHFISPVFFDRSGDEELPGWIDELPDRPTVYGTLGTTNFSRFPGAFDAIAMGVANQPYNAILTVGRGRDPAEVDPGAANVRVERYIPQSLLLPRCDAVICHSGFSSTLAALMHGLPLVAMPLGADQFDNAGRASRIGAAVVIDPDERTPERVREAVRTVLEDPAYRKNAERFRDEARSLPGLDYAVELLERLASTRKPLLRADHR